VQDVLTWMADDFATPVIGNDEARLEGDDFGRKRLGNGEEKPVTELTVFRPLLVNPEILNRGFDLDNPDGTIAADCDYISAPAGSKSELGQNRKGVGAHQAANTTLDRERCFRLAAIGPEFNCHIKPFPNGPFFNFA
jgi:hypothetical protein